MKTQTTANWKIAWVTVGIGSGILVSGCTEEEVGAVLSGVQVVAQELDNNEDVSFRDWLSSELDD